MKIPFLDRLEVCWSVMRGKAVMFNCRIQEWTDPCKPSGKWELNDAFHSSYNDDALSPHLRMFQNNKPK